MKKLLEFIFAAVIAIFSVSVLAATVTTVPNTRTVNGYPLSSDITLTSGDVGAMPICSSLSISSVTSTVTTTGYVTVLNPSGSSSTGTVGVSNMIPAVETGLAKDATLTDGSAKVGISGDVATYASNTFIMLTASGPAWSYQWDASLWSHAVIGHSDAYSSYQNTYVFETSSDGVTWTQEAFFYFRETVISAFWIPSGNAFNISDASIHEVYLPTEGNRYGRISVAGGGYVSPESFGVAFHSGMLKQFSMIVNSDNNPVPVKVIALPSNPIPTQDQMLGNKDAQIQIIDSSKGTEASVVNTSPASNAYGLTVRTAGSTAVTQGTTTWNVGGSVSISSTATVTPAATIPVRIVDAPFTQPVSLASTVTVTPAATVPVNLVTMATVTPSATIPVRIVDAPFTQPVSLASTVTVTPAATVPVNLVTTATVTHAATIPVRIVDAPFTQPVSLASTVTVTPVSGAVMNIGSMPTVTGYSTITSLPAITGAVAPFDVITYTQQTKSGSGGYTINITNGMDLIRGLYRADSQTYMHVTGLMWNAGTPMAANEVEVPVHVRSIKSDNGAHDVNSDFWITGTLSSLQTITYHDFVDFEIDTRGYKYLKFWSDNGEGFTITYSSWAMPSENAVRIVPDQNGNIGNVGVSSGATITVAPKSGTTTTVQFASTPTVTTGSASYARLYDSNGLAMVFESYTNDDEAGTDSMVPTESYGMGWDPILGKAERIRTDKTYGQYSVASYNIDGPITSTTITSVSSLVTVTVTGYPSVALFYTGTYSGITLGAQLSGDGTNYSTAVQCRRHDAYGTSVLGAITDNSTANWLCPTMGMQNFRVAAGAYTSGTMTLKIQPLVTVDATTVNGIVNLGGAIPTGSNVIGSVTTTLSAGAAGALAVGGTQSTNSNITGWPMLISGQTTTPGTLPVITGGTGWNRTIQIAGDGVPYTRYGGPVTWSCYLQSLGTTTTQCQALVTNYRLYVTDITLTSTTSTTAGYRLVYGTGSNCGTGGTGLYPASGANTPAFFVASANTAVTPVNKFSVPIPVAASNALCVVGNSGTNTVNVQINGFTAP